MKVRDLERLCRANGISAAKADMVTRSLRDAEELPVAGRGANAPEADAGVAAKILIAIAGSSKGNLAARRLAVLGLLRSGRGSRRTLLLRLTSLLEGSVDLEHLIQCRIGRNIREAQFIFDDGRTEIFTLNPAKDYSTRLRVEGVIPGAFLRELTSRLQETTSVPSPVADREEHEDS